MPRAILSSNVAQIDAPSGTRYTAGSRGGLFDVSDADAKAIVAAGGAVASLSGTTGRGLGYRCGSCGFGSYLKVCGRCGGECEREGAAPVVNAAAAGAAQAGAS